MPWNEFIHSDFYVRFILYGLLGFIMEVLFTSLCDLIAPRFLCSWNVHGNQDPTRELPAWRKARDRRLVGYSFLWMFPIYGLLVFLEPLAFTLSGLHFLLRGLIYGALFMVVEFLTGYLIKLLVGKCPWDYSYAKLSIKGCTRWEFFGVGFALGLVVEDILPIFIELTPAILQAFGDRF